MEFVKQVSETKVSESQVGVFWLGQAGFLFRTPQGRQIVIDPFFSDCVYRLNPQEGYGFKRMNPPVCEAGELDVDVLIISHEHPDHFDVDAIRDLVKDKDEKKTQVYTNCVVAAEMEKMGFDRAQIHVMEKGKKEKLHEFSLLPVDCDHGELAPEALGVILDFGFIRIYYAGDTALTTERLQVPITAKPELAILPINGAFGNLDGAEAAKYAGLLQCKVCIPCHFWTFPLHHGDPQQIIDCIGTEAPDCRLVMLRQGEGYLAE